VNTCATCCYHITEDVEHFDEEGEPVTERQGFCALCDSSYGEPTHPLSFAFAQDYERFRARLRVIPEFGCVLWMASDTAAQSAAPPPATSRT
jgi:hypothetical protein